MQVQKEASRLDPSLSVSSMLLLSCPELQDQYYRWMNRTPAVTWCPYFSPFFYFCASLKMLLSKNEVLCTGLAWTGPLPTTVLALVRVAMELAGAPKKFQSIASLVALAYVLTSGTALMALNDPCMLSFGPGWMSPAGNAVFVAIATSVLFAMTPCTMQHLAALCVILGPCHTLTFYIRSQKRHGGLGLISYPNHFSELIVIIAGAKVASLLVGIAVRYRLAQGNMIAFLRSGVRPHRH